MALVNSFPQAAGMGRRDGNRERQGRKASQKREEQQQSCGQAMHGFVRETEPQGGPSIEQNCKRAQGSGRAIIASGRRRHRR